VWREMKLVQKLVLKALEEPLGSFLIFAKSCPVTSIVDSLVSHDSRTLDQPLVATWWMLFAL